MESVDLEMGELFHNAVEEEDFVQAPPMPDLEDDDAPMRNGEGEENEDGEVDENVLAKLKDIKGGAKKRVLRPQPKLDSDRLQTDRGLPILPKLMKEAKFKGKGHEAHDLKLMMGKLEHWAHRLFPKITFDEFIEKLEKLGQKKAVQTCIKRIRLEIPILTNDVVENKSDNEDLYNNDANNGEDVLEDDMDAEEAFDEMIRQEREQLELAKKSQPDHVETTPSKSPPPSQEFTSPAVSLSQTPSQSQGASSLTEGQKERMERNKRIAMEKRMARLGKTPTGKSLTLDASQSAVEKSPNKENTPMKGSQDSSQESVNDAQRVMNTEDELLNLLTEEERNEIPAISKVQSQESCQETAPDSESVPNLCLSESPTKESTGTEELHLVMTETENAVQKNTDMDSNPKPKNEDTEQLHLVLTETENDNQNDTNMDSNPKPENEDTESDNMKLQLTMTECDMDTEPGIDNQTENDETETALKLELSDQSEEETEKNGQST